jgi:hypothetical protein
MEGSPNYITMVYNGTTASTASSRKGSEAITLVYQEVSYTRKYPD